MNSADRSRPDRRFVISVCDFRVFTVFLFGLIVLAASSAGGEEPASREDRESAIRTLEDRYEGVRVFDQAEQRVVYGVPQTAASTPERAAESWLVDHGAVLGMDAGQLELQREIPVNFGRFEVFHYTQVVDGLVVDRALARILVLEPGESSRDWWLATTMRGPSTRRSAPCRSRRMNGTQRT